MMIEMFVPEFIAERLVQAAALTEEKCRVCGTESMDGLTEYVATLKWEQTRLGFKLECFVEDAARMLR